MVNVRSKKQWDLDKYFKITDIKCVIFYDDFFYVCANKRRFGKGDYKLGYYLVKIPEDNPVIHAENGDIEKIEEMFLLNYQNKLDIGDVNMYVLKERTRNELIISYKTIYINMYCIYVINLENLMVIFRHESFCLWESLV